MKEQESGFRNSINAIYRGNGEIMCIVLPVRDYFSVQTTNWAVSYPDEDIPGILKNPFLRDVSDEYFGWNVAVVPLYDSAGDGRLCYLAVFNNAGWSSVAVGTAAGFQGVFEGANTPDFRDAVVLHRITKVPLPDSNWVRVNCPSEFRYLRYWGPKGSNSCIAEAMFFDADGKLIRGPVSVHLQTYLFCRSGCRYLLGRFAVGDTCPRQPDLLHSPERR